MAFDFQKAINGEPIYCNGERVYPYYSINDKLFKDSGHSWFNHGVYTGSNTDLNLSTDPPKKKVKVTAYVYTDLMGIPYVSSQKPNFVPHNFIEEKQFEIEI